MICTELAKGSSLTNYFPEDTSAQSIPQILVLDDDPQLRSLMIRTLTGSGFDVLSVGTAAEAMSLLETNENIAVVISDICLPQEDGLKFAQRLKKRFPERSWLQVIMVTGSRRLDYAVQAVRTMACDFLLKPFRCQELRTTVKRAVEASQKIRDSVEAQATAAKEIHTLECRISSLLDVAAAEVSSDSTGCSGEEGLRTAGNGDRAAGQMVKALIQERQERGRHFRGDLLDDPVWNMLLDLYQSRIQGKSVYVTSLCIAAGVPTATAIRRIEALETEGYVRRRKDAKDGRRILVDLTDDADERMAGCLAALSRNFAAV